MLASVRVICGAVWRSFWRSFARGYAKSINDMEQYGFPAIIRFCVYTLCIAFDLLLIPILIIFSNEVAIVLIANTYLNAMSSALGKINLRQQIEEHTKTRAIAQAAHDRTQETHRLTAEIHRHLTQPASPSSPVAPPAVATTPAATPHSDTRPSRQPRGPQHHE